MKRLAALIVMPIRLLLRHPSLIVEIGIVFLIALVWFAGPWVGFESVDGRIQLIIAIILIRAIVYVVQYVITQKRAAGLEASLRQEGQRQVGSLRAGQREELEAVRIQFEKGIAALKDSKLSKGLSGKAALYALPWYMFIGPSASGKSTALRHSGLQFPSLGGSGQGLQGLGGTRNCDWWFTNEGVLLDTAGRYVTQDDDQVEWLAFLDLLKKYRKDNPINGVIATIAVSDLVQGSDAEIELHAKRMRARIDELITHLGVVFPVYVMFTKCDLVQGFIEFFDELNRTERERVWGATFSRSADSSEQPGGRFRKEFEVLLSTLHERRLSRLANTRGSHKVSIFGFPMQMASVQERLGKFIDILFQGNPYQENPLFRGFYLTSGTQEGTPIDRVLGAVSRASGLSDVNVAAFTPTEPKSYFLKELFTDIVFPDRQLVGPSSTMYRQRGYLRVGVFVLAALLVLLSVMGLAVSFIGNKRMLSGALSAALQAPEANLDEAHRLKSLEYISELGGRVREILDYKREGIPLRLTGFYEGDRIEEEMREVYLRYFGQLFLADTKRDMESQLAQFTLSGFSGSPGQGGEYDDHYGRLKAYMMLGDPAHLKAAYLNEWLIQYWQGKVTNWYEGREVPQGIQDIFNQQMKLYSHYLSYENGSRLALHVRLIQEAQERLRQVPRVQRIYALSRKEAESLVKPFSLETVLQGAQQGSLTSDHTIPGIYTLVGWKGPFQVSVDKVLKAAGEEGWVIGEPEVDRVQLDKGIKRLYFQDYVRHWRDFLRSLRIKPAVTPVSAEESLAMLALADSPIHRVFVAVDQNTVPEAAAMSKIQETATGLLEKVKKGLGVEGAPSETLSTTQDTEELIRRLGDPNDFSGSVSLRFKSLHQLLSVPKGVTEDPPLVRYLTDLRKVHQGIRPILKAESPVADMKALAKSIVAGEPNDLLSAMKNTDAILQKLDPETIEAVSPVLIEPWMIAMRGVMERAKAEASRKWESEVYPACQRNVEGRFPFRVSGGDAPFADLAEFFHPESGLLWKFYQSELKPFTEEGLERWEMKQWAGIGLTVSNEFVSALQHGRLLSESLFSKGAADVGAAFELYPYPPQGALSKSVTEIRLEVGGQALRYRMEPQEWHEMKWPGPTPTNGAVLQVQVGDTWITKEFKDWWGFFRLIQFGSLVPGAGETQYRLQWDLPAADGQLVKVQYDLRARGHKNPFRPGLFEQFKCVEHF